MQVVNHRLVADPGDPWEIVDSVSPQDAKRPIITPKVLLWHYAVSESLAGTVATQRETGYKAHLTMDGLIITPTGPVLKVVQLIPFNMRGSHAGESQWKGEPSVNNYSIGVEVASWGPLQKRGDKFYTVGSGGKVEWPADQVYTGRHRIKACPYEYWCDYEEAETDFAVNLGLTLLKAYPSIEDTLGHDEVAVPEGRKIDPGPAWPMTWLKSQLFPTPTAPAV